MSTPMDRNCYITNLERVNLEDTPGNLYTRRGVWNALQRERRAIKSGSRMSTHKFMALEPMCGNFFCAEPSHMKEVSYSPTMAAAVTSPKILTGEGRDWDECFTQGAPTFDAAAKLMFRTSDVILKNFVRTCNTEWCVNPNHYRMKTKEVVDENGIRHRVAADAFIDARGGGLNPTGMTWLYMDLARGIGDGGSARIVEAEQTCGVTGCVSCWKVTKVWRCVTDLGEEVSGLPWRHLGGNMTGGMGRGSLGWGSIPIHPEIQVIGGGASKYVNAAINEFSPRAGRILALARSNGGHAVWDGAAVNGYPLISGRIGGHRKIIELDQGVSLEGVTLKNTCGCRKCILPEHWSGWQQLKDASRSEDVEKELAERKAITKSAIAEALRLDKENSELEAENEELKRKIAELMARLGDAGGGESGVT